MSEPLFSVEKRFAHATVHFSSANLSINVSLPSSPNGPYSISNITHDINSKTLETERIVAAVVERQRITETRRKRDKKMANVAQQGEANRTTGLWLMELADRIKEGKGIVSKNASEQQGGVGGGGGDELNAEKPAIGSATSQSAAPTPRRPLSARSVFRRAPPPEKDQFITNKKMFRKIAEFRENPQKLSELREKIRAHNMKKVDSWPVNKIAENRRWADGLTARGLEDAKKQRHSADNRKREIYLHNAITREDEMRRHREWLRNRIGPMPENPRAATTTPSLRFNDRAPSSRPHTAMARYNDTWGIGTEPSEKENSNNLASSRSQSQQQPQQQQQQQQQGMSRESFNAPMPAATSSLPPVAVPVSSRRATVGADPEADGEDEEEPFEEAIITEFPQVQHHD